MPRARNIKHSFFVSEQVADNEPLGRILFIGLWTIADYKGELIWKARSIKAQLLPFDDCDVSELAINLDKSGLVRFYSDGSSIYTNIPAFNKHQNPHKNEREKGSLIPAYSEEMRQAIDLEALAINRDKYGSKRKSSHSPPADSLILIPDPLIINPDTGTLNKEHSQATPSCVVFEYWQSAMNKPKALLTPKREKAIKAMLKTGYSIDQIKQAIDGCKSSPWHQGQNDRHTVYDDIELICRSGEKLESFINASEVAPAVEISITDQLSDRSWAN